MTAKEEIQANIYELEEQYTTTQYASISSKNIFDKQENQIKAMVCRGEIRGLQTALEILNKKQ